MRSIRFRAALAAATMAIAGASTVPAGAAQAAPTGAVSSGYNNWSCQPSAAHPEPVVLLHGLGATAYEDTGMYLASTLAAEGYCTFGLTYGATSVFGPFVGGVGPIAASAQQVAAFIDQVLAATHATKVDLVGHSEGAFLSLYVPKEEGDAQQIDRVVALAPPTHGTTFAGLINIADLLGLTPLALGIASGVGCAACSELVTGGSAVAQLNTGPVTQPGVTYTVITSTADELVTPTSTAFVEEPGVTNEYVQTSCPLDPVGHIGEAYDPDVAGLISNALDPAQAMAITCSYGLPF